MNIDDNCIVIGSKRSKDNDLIITVLSENNGKLKLYANGARYAKSPLASLSQLFIDGEFQIFMRSDLHKLNSGIVIENHLKIRDEIERLFLGTYILELVDKSTQESSPDRRLFLLLKHALIALDTASKYRLFKVSFTLKLIKALGYDIALSHCSNCDETKALFPILSVQHGGVLCGNCCGVNSEQNVKMTLGHIKMLNLLLNNPFDTVQKMDLCDIIVREIDDFLTRYVYAHLVDKKLKSLEALEDVL